MEKKLELAANVAIVIVAIVAVIVLGRNHLFRAASQTPEGLRPGTKINEAGFDWRRHQNTLLLALRPDCPFCTESASFYRQLVAESSNRPVHLTALFESGVENAETYLSSLGVRIDDVRRGAFPSLRLRGTPTLILVDNHGVVRGVWTGKVSRDTEHKVIESIRAAAPTTSAAVAPVSPAAVLHD